MQKLSSMQTSINTSKLPSVWGKLNYQWLAAISRIPTIVDYGCGRAATVQKVMINLNCELRLKHIYFPYDPYWGDVDRNRNAMSCLLTWQTADLCVCANVLNVIDDEEEIIKIIKEVTHADYWIFQIYEGNKTGIGKESKPGCWQRNMKTNDYIDIFHKAGVTNLYIKGNYIYNNLNSLK